MSNELRIAFTGGGTGGHIFPLLAVADEIKRILDPYYTARPYSLYYFGDPDSYAQEFSTRSIKVVRVGSSKLRRYMSVENILDAIKFPFTVLQAICKVFFVMPDVLFSKGGTGAFPVVCAAWLFRIPILIHESDSIPGLTNALSGRFATRIAVAFSAAADYFSRAKVAVVGNPIRTNLVRSQEDEALSSYQAKRIFGFDPHTPLLLILGGSQGSRRVNDFLLDNAKELVRKYQVLHQTGTANFEQFEHELLFALRDCISEERDRYKVTPFLKKDMREAYQACDVVVTRAGSGALFEISYFAKPSILIPLPEAGRNHQYYNAFAYAAHGAGVVIEEDNLKSVLFFDQLDRILKDEAVYKRMSTQANAFYIPHTASVLADEIIRLAVE